MPLLTTPDSDIVRLKKTDKHSAVMIAANCGLTSGCYLFSKSCPTGREMDQCEFLFLQ